MLSERVTRALIVQSKLNFEVANVLMRGGNGYLRRIIHGLNDSAKGWTYFLLTDLDRAQCPSDIISKWLDGQPVHPNLIFRIAVREVDSWLFADKKAFADFLGVNCARIPNDVDQIVDPKRLLIDISKHSRKGKIRRNLVPADGSTAEVGSGYNDILGDFVEKHWNAYRASKNSNSLKRALLKLDAYSFVHEDN